MATVTSATNRTSTLDPRLLAVYTAIALLTLIAAISAPAHLALERSSPAADAVLPAAPAEIRLWFTQRPESAVSMIRLTGPSGPVAVSDLEAGDENSLVVRVEGAMAAGAYPVDWRTSSGDGHPIRGKIAFRLEPREPLATLSRVV